MTIPNRGNLSKRFYINRAYVAFWSHHFPDSAAAGAELQLLWSFEFAGDGQHFLRNGFSAEKVITETINNPETPRPPLPPFHAQPEGMRETHS
jgi:hypothetical protein